MVSLNNTTQNLFFSAGALISLGLMIFSSLPLASAITWTVDFATITVNNTIYWDGHSFDYLNITYYSRSEIDNLVTNNITVALLNYVPYTGATGDLNLGAYDIYATNGYFNNSLNVTGDIHVGGNVEVDGNVTAAQIIGDGSGLTNLPGDISNDFDIFFDSSSYKNVTYNLTEGDDSDVNVNVEPGKKFIFGSTFT